MASKQKPTSCLFYLTPIEASKLTKVSLPEIKQALHGKHKRLPFLPAAKLGSSFLIRADFLSFWVDQCRASVPAAISSKTRTAIQRYASEAQAA